MFVREPGHRLTLRRASLQFERLNVFLMQRVRPGPVESDQFDQVSGTGGGPPVIGSVVPRVKPAFFFIPTMNISLETLLEAGGRIGRTTSNMDFVRSTSSE